MPIGTGSVAALGINLELERTSNASLSIDTAENGGYVAINQCSPSRPSASNPASYSEWRGYNHRFACCNTPTITSTSSTSDSITVNFSTSNCTATHIEYSSNGGSTWTSSSGGCTSPRTLTGLASGTTYLVRMRITCTSTGGYSGYTSNVSVTTGASCPAYGTFLSSYCSGCILYYRYANGSCGTYDVSMGCTTSCGGCCCAPGDGTYIRTECGNDPKLGCYAVDVVADGCYGERYQNYVYGDIDCCGGGGGGSGECQSLYSDGSGYYMYYDCFGTYREGYAYGYGDYIDCADPLAPTMGSYFDSFGREQCFAIA